ncbi:MAG: hypothetical protein J0G36_22070 [Afipia sp.]|nr:hypothetical protein [Afipia sp.]
MTTNDALVGHYLRAVAIGAVFVDYAGHIDTAESVEVIFPHGHIAFCCVRHKQERVAQRARALANGTPDREAAVASIRQAAAELSVGLTPHETVVKRAHVAVAKVEQTMADMQKTGALKAMNREFKAAREAGLASSYSAFIHTKKISLLEAMAAGRR